ncbi:Hypothetical protein SMAX5B_013241, partial [Scophthalmus maximus]
MGRYSRLQDGYRLIPGGNDHIDRFKEQRPLQVTGGNATDPLFRLRASWVFKRMDRACK